ncbi:MAG: DNA polymerase I, partial [Candidatus Wallbacteria bacterium]|nr:DNA polymerase I [Candidatus Wallbacteria bacterium]
SHETYVLTGDRDIFQLLDDKLKIVLTYKGAETLQYGLSDFTREYGITPSEFIDLKSLMGDQSDNIPGVPGIGEKTALTLIQKYHSLDCIYDHLAELTPSCARKLSENRALADLSRQLSTIITTVPLDLPAILSERTLEREKLTAVLQELELSSLIKKLSLAVGSEKLAATGSAGKYQSITTMEQWEDLLARLKMCRRFAVDLETDSEVGRKASIVGISLAFEECSAYYLPLRHFYLGVQEQLPPDLILGQLKELLENSQILKICHNAKYEYTVFLNYGIELKNFFDTMLASYLLDPEEHRHSLDQLALKNFNFSMQSFDGLFGKGEPKEFAGVEISRATEYSGADSDFTLRLFEIFSVRLREQELEKVFQEIELPLVQVLSEMEGRGISIDTAYLSSLSLELGIELSGLVTRIYELCGGEFNLNSPKQLEDVLFNRLKLPTYGKTTKGTGFSTDVSVLEKLRKDHPVAELMLGYRTVSKLKSTYVDALPELRDNTTGRIHTSFNQTVAATGRLSSSNPNLQNIPVRDEQGRKIRHAFIAPEGFSLLSFDYSQIELRVLAHLSEDANLISAFLQNQDIHSNTAASIFGVQLSEVSKEMRRKAKEINFGVVYGLNAYGLSERLEITNPEAKEYLARFFAAYPGIRKYLDATIEKAKTDGFVTTLFGRKRWVERFLARNGNLMKHGENVAVNAPIQGTAADLIKIAMIRISRELPYRMLLQVHDELIFEVKKEEIEAAIPRIRQIMEGIYTLKVPLLVDHSIGRTWGELK